MKNSEKKSAAWLHSASLVVAAFVGTKNRRSHAAEQTEEPAASLSQTALQASKPVRQLVGPFWGDHHPRHQNQHRTHGSDRAHHQRALPKGQRRSGKR